MAAYTGPEPTTEPSVQGPLVLAFDIERSGGGGVHETIAIGASVLDATFRELDTLFLPCYFPPGSSEPSVFEKRCWDEFWCSNKDVLDKLVYTGGLCKAARQTEMIEAFQAFRVKWEAKALQETQTMLILASDNPVFDGGYINSLIGAHLPSGTLPIPYTATFPQAYRPFVGVHDMQGGMLMAIDPARTDSWGHSCRVAQLYGLPPARKKHTHLPDEDAYTIAYDLQVLYGIQAGRITRRIEDLG
jgi:hypothetical protein